ncbi:rhodanese-like domain-containing protein [Bacillus fonticola]|uniref:rhodanese-like domain-containing protein n=1 Tax=Bacillus fonticola TaxID=2728853 RepID=UPI0014729C60|nr:rhodanese-like domain-containing protein [Bacillus fonticola]
MSEIPTITPKEVEAKLQNGEKLALVDVREDDEVSLGMIPEAKHIPMAEIPERLEEFDQGVEYIFVCRSGRRSDNVSRFMQMEGFQVRNMIGGMLEYEGHTEPKN